MPSSTHAHGLIIITLIFLSIFLPHVVFSPLLSYPTKSEWMCSSIFLILIISRQMVVQLPCRWWWWWWMRAGESWEASRYVQYAPAVVGPKGSACPLHVAMPSIATFPIDLLASAPSPLKHAIALIAIFSCFSCNFPTVSPNLRLYHSFSPFHHHTNSIGVGWEIGYWSLSYKPATFLICFAIFFFPQWFMYRCNYPWYVYYSLFSMCFVILIPRLP